MANQKYDGVIEAVHYHSDGQIDWVRAYLRRGPTWSDRLILKRQDLIDEIKAGRRIMLGQRVEYMGGTFDVTAPVHLTGAEGMEVLVTDSAQGEKDRLEGASVL